MKLEKILLRYSPPGIGLAYYKNGQKKEKMIDLLELNTKTNISELGEKIFKEELLITESVKPKLHHSLAKLQERLCRELSSTYEFHKCLNKHLLPIASVAINKEGSKCATGSFDHNCSVWNTETGALEYTILTHTGAVYAVTFTEPHGDRIITGSFDKSASVTDASTGEHLKTFWGHQDEIVVVKYEHIGNHIATASLDKTAKLYDAHEGDELWTITGHNEAIVSVNFSCDGRQILTGSFDSNMYLWDLRSHEKVASFSEHNEEISSCLFNFNCTLIGSGSVDKTAKIWDLRSTKSISTISNNDEVLDVNFDSTGRKFAIAGSDGYIKVIDVTADEHRLIFHLFGHQKEVSKVCFSPGGELLLTGSADGTCRIWRTDTGQCLQILVHKDDIFQATFSYDGSLIATVANDCICKLWKQTALD